MLDSEEEKLATVTSLKSLVVLFISHSNDDDEGRCSLGSSPNSNNHNTTRPAAVRSMFNIGLQMFLSCVSLERVRFYEERGVYTGVPHLTRKQVFLDYCKAVANSQTVKDVFLPSPHQWWRDQECLDAVLHMVRSNKRLIKFDTQFSEDAEVNEARREIDFWLWLNANVDEEKLVRGTTPASLWPFLIERLMRNRQAGLERCQVLDNVRKRRTAGYLLLKQRVDLVLCCDRNTGCKRRRGPGTHR